MDHQPMTSCFIGPPGADISGPIETFPHIRHGREAMEEGPFGHFDITGDEEGQEPGFGGQAGGALGQSPAQLGPICVIEPPGHSPLAQLEGLDREDGDRGHGGPFRARP
jgi:hypothetical protein